ncbi:branched-chain amino acid ABC transporter permease [Castellaniella denitrificans]|uniref:branched-chain amino acid ABC transporter permease n=1 Tax=Castellaniella denitrificans TaxID=56119 RepID=UPI001AC69085|nr:branched-chain amino acid ABC transporter permease [Burkholderiales bacterium]
MELFWQLLIHGLLTGCLYALVGISWGLIYATSKVFHFAHVLTLLLSTYLAVMVVNQLGTSYWIGFIIAAVVGGIFGALCEVVVYRPLRRLNATPLNIFLASLGLLEAGKYTMQLIWGANPIAVHGAPAQAFHLGPVSVTLNHLLWLAFSIVLIAGLLIWLNRSRTGRAIRAVATNPYLSASVGVSAKSVYVAVFIIGSAMAGIAGYLLALSHTASLGMGLIPVLAGFTATFLGGVGSLRGTILGGLILGLAEQMSGLFLSGEWQTVTAFSVLVLVLMLRPQGLFQLRR